MRLQEDPEVKAILTHTVLGSLEHVRPCLKVSRVRFVDRTQDSGYKGWREDPRDCGLVRASFSVNQ